MEAIENEIIRGLPPQLRTAVGIWFAQVAVTFVAGEITQNYSQGEEAKAQALFFF